MTGPVRVFIASSLDGFIAGPGDDLSWLPGDGGEDHGYTDFMAATAAILIGRTTYDVVLGFDEWPYEDTPVFVATSRPLEPAAPTVRVVSGEPEAMLAAVREVTTGGIYVDGGVALCRHPRAPPADPDRVAGLRERPGDADLPAAPMTLDAGGRLW